MNLLKGTWILLTMLAIALFVNHACAQTAKVVELTKEEAPPVFSTSSCLSPAYFNPEEK